MMQATVKQIQQILILSRLDHAQLEQPQPHTIVKSYAREAIILYEGDRLPPHLFAVLSGRIEIKKMASTGKETIFRTLPAGELFASPSLIGDRASPATVIAMQDCEILTIERTALLGMIQNAPELALQIIAVLTERLQNLHQVVHDLASERAIVRLAHCIQSAAIASNYSSSSSGDRGCWAA